MGVFLLNGDGGGGESERESERDFVPVVKKLLRLVVVCLFFYLHSLFLFFLPLSRRRVLLPFLLPRPLPVVAQPLPQKALNVLRPPVVDSDGGSAAASSAPSVFTSTSTSSSTRPLPFRVQKVDPRRRAVPVPELHLPLEGRELGSHEFVDVAVGPEARAAHLEDRRRSFRKRRVERRVEREGRRCSVRPSVVRRAAAAAVGIEGAAARAAAATTTRREGQGQGVAGGAERVGEAVGWVEVLEVLSFFSPPSMMVSEKKKERASGGQFSTSSCQ